MVNILQNPPPAENEPELAELTRGPRGTTVRLPPRYARAAVDKLLEMEDVPGRVVMGPADIQGLGSIAPEEWAIIAQRPSSCPDFAHDRPPLWLVDAARRSSSVYIFPKHTVVLPAHEARRLQRALEAVKPEVLEPDGRPRPWVPVRLKQRTPAIDAGRDEDVEVVAASGALPELPAVLDGFVAAAEASATITTSEIHTLYRDLCDRLALRCVELVVRRGTEDRRGFVTGRVWQTPQGQARRVAITTCPNADRAEILATLVHELAHPVSGCPKEAMHDLRFRETLVGLAERAWGKAYFAAARLQLAESYHVVDRWVASGIRAGLLGSEPPAPRTADDGHAARIISKVTKLRALAADQLGKPEAIAATAQANDLVTLYGLGSYAVELEPAIHDGMVDRWVLLQRGKVWQRTLAFAVANFNGVFALSMKSRARMHFFGRYSNVVAAEYLFNISAERIVRDCDNYVQGLRQRTGPRGNVRRAAIAFCDSAVAAFAAKLQQMSIHGSTVHPDAVGPAADDLVEAEHFARQEHEKRGMSWGSGRERASRFCREGAEAGRHIPIVRGLDSSGRPRRQLGHRSS